MGNLRRVWSQLHVGKLDEANLPLELQWQRCQQSCMFNIVSMINISNNIGYLYKMNYREYL